MKYKRVFIPNSILFITIVTKDRRFILLENITSLISAIEQTKNFYDYDIVGYVVLDNHIHLLLKPDDINQYPKIIRSIKYNFTKDVGIAMPTYDKIEVWQNRYFEHTIIDEEDLNKHLDYIHYNPVKHGYVNKARDWKYSSFHEYVKNGFYDEDWCNFEDKYKIKECDYE